MHEGPIIYIHAHSVAHYPIGAHFWKKEEISVSKVRLEMGVGVVILVTKSLAQLLLILLQKVGEKSEINIDMIHLSIR